MRGARHSETARKQGDDLLQARAAWLFASDLASSAFGADVRTVVKTRGTVGRGGTATVSVARKVACYLASVVANASPSRLAEASGIDRKTIYGHAAWVEDQRDDPAFDAKITELENALFGMAARIVMAKLGLAAAEGQAAA